MQPAGFHLPGRDGHCGRCGMRFQPRPGQGGQPPTVWHGIADRAGLGIGVAELIGQLARYLVSEMSARLHKHNKPWPGVNCVTGL